jgi:hypothetical protein
MVKHAVMGWQIRRNRAHDKRQAKDFGAWPLQSWGFGAIGCAFPALVH